MQHSPHTSRRVSAARTNESGRAARLVGIAVACGIALGGPSAARAQIVHGQVLEQGTERPVAGATVTAHAEDKRVVATVATDSSGAFLLTLPSGGTFALGIRHVGHQPGLSRPFNLLVGDEYEPTLYLSTVNAAQPLAPVRIRERANRRGDFSNGFEERRTRGFGEFMTRVQIARRGSTTPVELLRGMTGVTFAKDYTGDDIPISSRGAVGYGRPCRMAVYIDGSPLLGQPLDAAIRPSDMEAIEVYASSAEMPAQFRLQDAGCGAIFIWSRKP